MDGSISLHQHIFNAAVSSCYKVYKFSSVPLTHIFAKQQKYALNEIVCLTCRVLNSLPAKKILVRAADL